MRGKEFFLPQVSPSAADFRLVDAMIYGAAHHNKTIVEAFACRCTNGAKTRVPRGDDWLSDVKHETRLEWSYLSRSMVFGERSIRQEIGRSSEKRRSNLLLPMERN